MEHEALVARIIQKMLEVPLAFPMLLKRLPKWCVWRLFLLLKILVRQQTKREVFLALIDT